MFACRPSALRLSVRVEARLTHWHENLLPAAFVIAPALRLKDERPLSGVGHNEAVDDVMKLTAEAAALIDLADELLRRRAVGRVLQVVESLLNQVAEIFGFLVTEIFVAVSLRHLTEVVEKRSTKRKSN